MSTVDENRLQQLLDRTDIIDVQLRYALGTDSHDWELFRSCFTDQIEVDFSAGFGLPVSHTSADDWVKGVGPSMESFKATQHLMSNFVVSFDDADHARCITYVRATHHLPNFTGDSDQTVYGYYDNLFERTADGWKISRVKLVSRFMSGNFGVFSAAIPKG